MSFEVTIIRNSDGARVTYVDLAEWDEGSQFIWTEGNLACDCNREMIFAELMNLPNPWPECICGKIGSKCKCPKPLCGNTRFSVILPEEQPAPGHDKTPEVGY